MDRSHRKSIGRTPPPDLAELIVMARLDSGDPFLVQKRVDDGVVVQAATACDADWSDLPMRPIYLPLMQQLVVSMASQVAPPQNISTGEPIVAVFRGASSDVPLSLTTPDGGRFTVSLQDQGGRSVARFLDTQRPGVYTLTSPDGNPIHYVAQSSRQESDLTLLDEPAFAKLADEMRADIARSAADYLDRDRLRRHGREVWHVPLGMRAGIAVSGIGVTAVVCEGASMTSVRFVGVLPWWLGLLLALAGSILAWRYYRREAHNLTGSLRWVLPLLRSMAIFLVVFVLSGPVLHHRNVVGVLGRVLIYLDGSQSMGATDKQMSAARKVLVAQQLGWLPSTQVDTRAWKLAEELASIRAGYGAHAPGRTGQ